MALCSKVLLKDFIYYQFFLPKLTLQSCEHQRWPKRFRYAQGVAAAKVNTLNNMRNEYVHINHSIMPFNHLCHF